MPARIGDPAEDAIPVTPSDTQDLPLGTCQELLIGTGGNLSVITRAGNQRDLTGVPAGRLRLQVRRVRATGTTASNITALY
jgi:hypothetical protein